MTRTSKKTSKKQVKTDNFYFYILSSLNDNPNQSMQDIGNKLSLSKQNISYYTRQFKDKELIEKVGYGTWQVTENAIKILKKPNAMEFLLVVLDKHQTSKNNSFIRNDERGFRGFPMINYNKRMDMHNIQLKIPILSGQIDLKKQGGKITKGFRNWIPEYLEIYQPIKMTVRNNNNKSLSVFLASGKIKGLSDIETIISNARVYLQTYFKQHDVNLDFHNTQVIKTEIAREDDVAKDKLNKGDKILERFNKNRKKILPKDPNQQSQAWLDTSPDPSIETNDIDYMYAYLRMPFNIEQSMKIISMQNNNLARLTEQINAHIPAMIKLGEGAEKLGNNTDILTKVIVEGIKSIKKTKQEMEKKAGQLKIGDFS